MLNSTVSTAMLSALCTAHSVHHVETLTGFKWLGNTALRLSDPTYSSPVYKTSFAFEEALGYMFPSILADKDGVSAACVFLAAATTWHAEEDMTPYAKMQQLYSRYGYFGEANTYLISPSPTVTTDVFANIRSLGKPSHAYPQSIGGRKIKGWRDLTIGYDSNTADHVPDLPVDESSQMITCVVEGGIRFTARGSGTEPKIKLYIEAVASEEEGGMVSAKSKAKAMQHAIVEEWFEPRKWGLRLPG